MQKKINNWKDFIANENPYDLKISELRTSNIFQSNPKDLRAR